jgi:DNA repair exonuclease SbcCD ATPase subunit
MLVSPEGKKIMGRDARETQEIIEKHVGLSFDAFCQAVYSAQNASNYFLTSNETQKVSVLSEIIDLSVFDSARERCHVKIKDLDTKIAECARKSEILSVKLSSHRSNLKQQSQTIATFRDHFTKSLAALTKKQEELSLQLSKIVAPEGLLEAVQNEKNLREMLRALEQKKREIESSSALVEKTLKEHLLSVEESVQAKLHELRHAEKVSEGVCPTCKQEVSVSQEVRKESIKNLEDKISKLVQQRLSKAEQLEKVLQDKKLLPEIEAEREKIELLWRSAEEEVRSFSQLKQTETSLKRESSSLQQQIQDLRQQESSFSEIEERVRHLEVEIDLLAKELYSINQQKETLEEEKARYSTLKSGFQEVKTYIFSNILKDLSKRSTETARKLFEVPVSVEFSTEVESGKVSKILTKVELDGVLRSIGLLSGGQFRRIQLAVDLALSEIIAIRSKKVLNFRILDEPFKDLSEASMEKMVNLLGTLGGSTLLIEHNTIAKTIVGQTFFIEYRNGESRHAD